MYIHIIRRLAIAVFGLTLLMPGAAVADTNTLPFELDTAIPNPCAVFNDPQSDPSITRIIYGENVAMSLRGQIQGIIETTDTTVNLKFQINAHGDGVGQTSGVNYVFNGKALLKANISGMPSDPNFRFSGKFKIDARLIGQGKAATTSTVAQGAQDNAVVHFYVGVTAVGNPEGGDPIITKSDISTLSLECVASPWNNQMTSLVAGTKKAAGRGFGDVWNKYAWSMKDFGGGMVVGTKNAYFNYPVVADISQGDSSSTPANDCYANLTSIPSIYRALGCAELFVSGSNGGVSSADAKTRFAEIWRYDHTKKTWSRSVDSTDSQGFRVMETYGGKLYAGSDLGSFVLGIKLGSWDGVSPGGTWDFPGSRLLVSTDGKAFNNVASCVSSGPCNSADDVSNPLASGVNISIRAMAAYSGKLYVGTFNTSGAELWSFDGTNWSKIHTFTGMTGVTELRVFQNKLYIGLGGPVTNDYLYVYDGSGTPSVVAGLPDATGTLGVLKLFPSARNVLFIGIANLNPAASTGPGFKLYTYDGTTTFTTVTENGFFNPYNAYAWSMNEANGRVFVGTFNADFFATLPRGSAELWYSDDLTNWQQQALPVSWGLWNYGIRTMEIGNKQFFLGSASNVIAPDLSRPDPSIVLPPGETYLSPGAEVWTIRTLTVAPKK